MRGILLALFILFVCIGNTQVSNEVKEKSIENQDSMFCKQNLSLAKKVYYSNPDSTLIYLDRAIEYCINSDIESYQKATFTKGQILKHKSQYEKALHATNLCLIDSIDNKMELICLKQKAELLRYLGSIDTSISILKNVLYETKYRKDTSFLPGVHGNIAIAYAENQQPDSAIVHYLLSSQYYKNANDTVGYAIQMANIAASYIDRQDYKIAVEYANQGLDLHTRIDNYGLLLRTRIATANYKLGIFEKAIEQHNFIISKAEEIGEHRLLNGSMVELANIYVENNQSEKAEEVFGKIKVDDLSLGQKRNTLFGQAEVALLKGNCPEAERIYNLIRGFMNNSGYDIQRQYYRGLGIIEACKGGSHLVISDLMDSSWHYADSLFEDKKASEFKELHEKYKVKQKKDSIQLLQSKNINNSLTIKNQRLSIWAIILLFISSLFVIYHVTRLLKKTRSRNTELIYENEELNQINISLKDRLESLDSRMSMEKTSILHIKSLDKTYQIDTKTIRYIKAEDDGVRIFLEESSIWSYMSLKNILPELKEEKFIQIFRSTIVNLDFIAWVNHVALRLKDGTELKIGRTYKDLLKKAINQK